MPPSHHLAIRLLGGFALAHDGQARELAYEKGRALLAYLAAEPGRAHPRESLAAMFWPDHERAAALTNLRQVLHDLRKVINAAWQASPPLQVSRDSVRLALVPGLELDLVKFQEPGPSCPSTPCSDHCSSCLARMAVQCGLYLGEFLAGFAVSGCPDFEAWLQVQREAFHLRALSLLARLSDCHEQRGDPEIALQFAMRFHRLEPWNEVGLRRLMRLQTRSGQRGAALAAYDACCQALKDDLDVLPSANTQALAQAIRQGDFELVSDRVAVAAPADGRLPVTEWRQVTALYCRLVPVGVDDPEALLALLSMPQARCWEIVQAYQGHVVQAYGGSFLAYFGYPHVIENAARAAVQAALALSATAFMGFDLTVGIHTGVVISGGEPLVPDAIGATSGMAIRLRQLAQPGEVVISSSTRHLVAGYFACESIGLPPTLGKASAQEVFQVKRSSGARDRLEAATALSPLVGRDDEMATLLALWQEACQGTQRSVLLRGEAGIGKSRLVLALQSAITSQRHTQREIRCFAQHRQSPFYPLVALLGDSLAFAPEDNGPARFDKLAAGFEAQPTKAAASMVALLAAMLGLPLRAPYQASLSSPQQQREQLLALTLDRLQALATAQPMLLVVEDLHWADPSTVEFLTLLVAHERRLPLLAVFTARPEFQSPWPASAVVTLDLQGLADRHAVALVGAVAPTVTSAITHDIVARADGIPLYVEELAREAVAQSPAPIPSSLQDLLATRLGNLGSAKTVAQAAAAIGREFSVKLLRAVLPFDAATLSRLLRQLQDARLLQPMGNEVFRFRHALIGQAAYRSQTRDDRESVHRRIAASLQSDHALARPELLAHHWAAGGETRAAITCWIEAGKLATQCSASKEAVSHFQAGLDLIGELPSGAERMRLELDLQIGLGAAACAAEGYASKVGSAAYARAMTLCDEHESGPDMFCSVWGLWASSSSRVGYPGALDLTRQLLRMASQSGDSVQAQQAHFARADTLYWRGEFATALNHLDRVAALYQPQHHARHVAGYGEDAGVTGGAYQSWVLWFLGYADQALVASAQSVALARQLEHPFSLAYALTFAAILRCRLRDPHAATLLADETLGIANEHGFPLWQMGARLVQGWAQAQLGHTDGAENIRLCVEATRAAMGGVTLVVLAPLVDAYLAQGAYAEALAVHGEAMAVAQSLGDGHADAELYRLKGEALLGLEPASERRDAAVEACYQWSVLVAQRQQAKFFELRATVGLARLWLAQDRAADARALLATIYCSFSEGFDTPDLKDARHLLDSLGAAAPD